MSSANKLRKIPPVHLIMSHPKLESLIDCYSRFQVLQVVQEELESIRKSILNEALLKKNDDFADMNINNIVETVQKKLEEFDKPNLKKVINATGVVLHTNLGRAPLPNVALEAVKRVAQGYSNLELNLQTGKRGKRYDHIRSLLIRLTGAEDALVVNNNAAAVLLVLSSLARGKEVIVSRGQLVEIGGSFRVPDVMEQSGAKLVEVGTTNKTHLSDYENAINENTALLLKVHPSNYRVIGFVKEVGLNELVNLGANYQIPVVEDLGSGVLIADQTGKFSGEPSVQSAVQAGADIVTFSGDKLLGGPQAGIIVGRKQIIEKIANHPLTRALRIDKMTLAALESILKLYINPEEAKKEIPALAFIYRNDTDIENIVLQWLQQWKEILSPKADVSIIKVVSSVGGGSLPGTDLPSFALRIKPIDESAQLIAERLRYTEVPVVCRVNEDALLFDFRTIPEQEHEHLGQSIAAALNGGRGKHD